MLARYCCPRNQSEFISSLTLLDALRRGSGHRSFDLQKFSEVESSASKANFIEETIGRYLRILMNIHGPDPTDISRHGISRHQTRDHGKLSYYRTNEPTHGFSPNLGSCKERTHATRFISQIGKYLLLELIEGDHVFRAAELHSGLERVCKVFDITRYQESLAAYFCLSPHKNINQIVEILLGDTKAYVFFESSHGDMHSFVRSCKKLQEDEAARLFHQMASAVAHCHDNGLVLRDIKLRKFVFKNADRSVIMLDGLEDARLLRGEDDSLSDKHGCPAYVSPEVLCASSCYSGRAADVWSLGVMLYTMLMGRYPFHDLEPRSLFSKIRRGHFSLPDSLTPKARCLIRSVLHRDPVRRLTSRDILDHPWLSPENLSPGSGRGADGNDASDQKVPDTPTAEEHSGFSF